MDDPIEDGRFGPPLRLSPVFPPPQPFVSIGKGSIGSPEPSRKFSRGKDDMPIVFDKLEPFENNSGDSLRVPLFEPPDSNMLQKSMEINTEINTGDEEWSALNWTKGEKIGSGGFATVYRGLNNETGEMFAAKWLELESKTPRNSKKIKEALQELRLMRRLNHPNIVRYLGAQMEEDGLVVFVELMTGGSISSLLAKFGPLSEQIIKKFTKQIVLGLEYLHNNQIIHRDIKGANVLVDIHGVVKLADFGCARIFQGLHTYQSNCNSVLGTPYFMAPEVIRGQSYGKSADIWSLGCTICEMSTGRPPWSQHFEPAAAMFHIGNATDASEIIPENLSTLGRHFLALMLRVNRKERSKVSDLLEHPFLS